MLLASIGDITQFCRKLLNFRSVDFYLTNCKVFDLGEEAPDEVLRRIFLNLEKLKLNGDELAANIQKKLRLIVSF